MDWKLLVLAFVAIGTLYKLVLHIVQSGSANRPTPENVSDVYDKESYTRWKAYNGEKSRLSIVSTLLSFAVLAVLLLTDAHAAFASLFPDGAFMQLLAVVLLQTLVDFVMDVPLQYIDTMIIEQKYGFNRSTVKTFAADQIRNLLLALFIGVGLMGILLLLHTAMGDWVVVLFAGFMLVLSLVISFLYPILSRIGNKFVPLEEGELRDKLMALLTKYGYQVKAIEVMDASRRTTKLNAYFTGFGKMKTIVLYDNLLNAMTTDEICAVFAHELGHGLNKDVLKMQILNVGNYLLMGLTVWAAVSFPVLHSAFGFCGVNYGFAYILTSAGLNLVQPLFGMVTNARSRAAEYRADRQAVKEGYGEAMITAFKKLAKENFADLAPAPALVVLEYSHPPLSKRVDAVEKAMK